MISCSAPLLPQLCTVPFAAIQLLQLLFLRLPEAYTH
jgi:hypothetical protein